MKRLTKGTLALAAAAAMGAAWTAGGIAAPEKKDIVIGAQCDRTGPTQLVGVSLWQAGVRPYVGPYFKYPLSILCLLLAVWVLVKIFQMPSRLPSAAARFAGWQTVPANGGSAAGKT